MFSLPQLNFDYASLEPFIDEKTMMIHHQKHHQAYIDNLNKLLERHIELEGKDLEYLLKNYNSLLFSNEDKIIFKNHGGGTWNHNFFWKMIAPKSKRTIFIDEFLKNNFQGYENFKNQFIADSISLFGSGWIWISYNEKTKQFQIEKTTNQLNPLMENRIPIFGVDLWEHAYYLTYQNKRKDYLENFFEIINWNFVEENIKQLNLELLN